MAEDRLKDDWLPTVGWRVLTAATLVFVFLLGLAFAVGWLTSLNQRRSEHYTAILSTFLDWPTLAFIVSLIFIFGFYREIAKALSRIRVKQFEIAGMKVIMGEMQTIPPEKERPLQLELDGIPSQEQFGNLTFQQDPAPTDDRTNTNEFEQRIAKLERESKHWWLRFLAVYLTAETRAILVHLTVLGPFPDDSLSTLAALILPGYTYPLEGSSAHPQGGYPDAGRFSVAVRNAIESLDAYDLISRSNGTVHVTDQGREFVDFVSSPEGRELIESLSGRYRIVRLADD